MATMPVQLDEEALILDRIADVPLPEGVRFKRIEDSEMWTGEPAWRLYYSVSRRVPLTKARGQELRRMKDAIQDRIFALKLERWPFVEFLETR